MQASSSKKQLKTSYRASPRSIRPVYTGGPVLLTKDGQWLITTLGEEVLITQVRNGVHVARVKGDSTPITALTLSYHTEPPTLITCHQSTSIRFYPLIAPAESNQLDPPYLTFSRQVTKAHSAPILVAATAPDSSVFATGSSDGVVKVWDSAGGFATHLFRGHGGPVSALKFSQPNDGLGRLELFTGSTDTRVRLYDLLDQATRTAGGAAKPKHVLEGHVSVVRGIDVSSDGRWALTGGRDKVVLVWDLDHSGKNGKGKKPAVAQTIIVQEQLETVGIVTGKVLGQSATLACFTGGEKGQVRIWNALKGTELGSMSGVEGVDEASVEEDEQRGIVNVLYDSNASVLLSVHADHNLIFHSLTDGTPTRQVVGFNDEIIDTALLSTAESSTSHSHLALATNSALIRMYSTDTLDARLLSGHKDIVLCLATSSDHRLLVSGSKDSTARLWLAGPTGQWSCIGLCEGHAESIGAVTLSRKTSEQTGLPLFLVTASQDRTAKLWDLTDLDTGKMTKPRSLATLRIHEKDINSLDLSPNDRFLASGSQDKLVKIFEVDYTSSSSGARGNLRQLGTCKGHRRGVWTVKFSTVDRIVASGAADRTVKLWSLDDFSCLKTFEGHTNSVLRVDFLSQGMQLITSASDGLVKLWNIRDEECIKTLDNHEDKIWAFAVSSDEKTIVSAGADSIATFWEDATELEQAEANEKLIQSVQTEQDFTNFVALKDYRRAILLALAMSQPGRLLTLFTAILTSPQGSSITGSPEVDEIVRTLPPNELVRLLKHVRDWNTNARTSAVAQAILHAILRLRSPEEILEAFEKPAGPAAVAEMEVDGDGEIAKPKSAAKEMGVRELLDGLIPYSERHFARMDRLVQESYMLDYLIGEMDGGIGGLFGGGGGGGAKAMEVDV